MPASYLNFHRKGSCIVSQIHLIQFDILKDHIQKQTVQDCVFCKFVICVCDICVYSQYVLFLQTAVIILCCRFSHALVIPSQPFLVNEKVLFGKSRDSLQNMHKSIMVSRCV